MNNPAEFTSQAIEAPQVPPEDAEIVTLNALRQLARLNGVRGPLARDTLPYVDAEHFPQSDVPQDLEVATSAQYIAQQYTKLAQRNNFANKAIERDLPQKLTGDLTRITSILGNPESPTTLQAARKLATYHDSRYVENFMHGGVIDETINRLADPTYAHAIKKSMTNARLLKLASNNPRDPQSSLDTIVKNASELLQTHADAPKIFTSERLTALSFESTDPRADLQHVVSLHDESSKKYPHIPDSVHWEVGFAFKSRTDTAERAYERMERLHRTLHKPVSMTESQWWSLLYRSRDEGVVARHVTQAAAKRSATSLRSDGEQNGVLAHERLISYTEQSPATAEVVRAAEWGADLVPSVEEAYRTDPERMGKALEAMAKLRKNTEQIGLELGKVFDDKAAGSAFVAGIMRRSTELLFDVAANEHADGIATLVMLEAVTARIRYMFSSSEQLENILGSDSFRTTDPGVVITLKHGTRVGFTVTLPESAWDALAQYGLTKPDKAKASDRKIGLRLDYDDESIERLTMDIGSYEGLRNPPYMGVFVGRALNVGHNAVEELRGNSVVPAHIKPMSGGVAGYHTNEHFDASRFEDSRAIKHMTSKAQQYFTNRAKQVPEAGKFGSYL